MNIFEGRWPQFKKEFFSILVLSITQVWWFLHIPMYTKHGVPFCVLLSLIGVGCCVAVFLFPEKFTYMLNVPYKSVAQKIFIGIIFLMTMFFVWKRNLYGFSGTHREINRSYVLVCVYFLFTLFLMFKAIKRYKNYMDNNEKLSLS